MPSHDLLRNAGLVALIGATACVPTTRMTLGTSNPPRVAAVTHPGDEGRVTGYHRATIRTTVKGQSATGASCRMIAPNLSLEFLTPAEVVIPVMHRPLGPATLTCRFGSHRGAKTMHADRKMNLRDDDPDMPFGYIIGPAATLASGTINMWSYFPDGSTVTVELAP